MALQDREKKLIPFGIGALILTLLIVFWPSSADAPKVVSMSDSPEAAEKRLAKTLLLVALAPAKEEEFRRASADLEKREKGMIQPIRPRRHRPNCSRSCAASAAPSLLRSMCAPLKSARPGRLEAIMAK